jgi:hypothetical protein
MAEQAAPLAVKEAASRPARQTAGTRFPYYDLADSVAVAKTIHDNGGMLKEEQLAAFLGYNTTKSGAFLSRVGAARLFDLITKERDYFIITPRAQQVLFPVYDGQSREALVEAFLSIPLFKAIYEIYRGRELPQTFGMKNLLRTRFQLNPRSADVAHRTLIDSAEQAGFFAARAGKTQLIIPTIPRPTDTPIGTQQETVEDVDGRGEDPPPPPPLTEEDLRNQYVATLIEIVREKGKKGEVDLDLMARIEKLLNI